MRCNSSDVSSIPCKVVGNHRDWGKNPLYMKNPSSSICGAKYGNKFGKLTKIKISDSRCFEAVDVAAAMAAMAAVATTAEIVATCSCFFVLIKNLFVRFFRNQGRLENSFSDRTQTSLASLFCQSGWF